MIGGEFIMQGKGMLLGAGLLVGAAVIAAVLVNSYKGNPADQTSTQTLAPAASPEAANVETPAVEVREVTVTGDEYSFSPASLTFTNGETVKLTFKNAGKMPHDFVVDELGIKSKVIAGGTEDTATFTVEKPGTFESYCSIGNHRAMGMKGSVVVK